MQAKIVRDRSRDEGEYGAWDATVWDGEELVGIVSGATRDECLAKARAKAEKYAATQPVEETVEL